MMYNELTDEHLRDINMQKDCLHIKINKIQNDTRGARSFVQRFVRLFYISLILHGLFQPGIWTSLNNPTSQ